MSEGVRERRQTEHPYERVREGDEAREEGEELDSMNARRGEE